MDSDRKKKDIVELTRCSAGEFLRSEKLPLRVLADNVRSMHNIGSIFRTSDAFCVEEVILAGISGTPPHPEIAKTALGAEESVRWRHTDDAVAEAGRMRQEGWTVLVLEQAHGSVPLSEFSPVKGPRCGPEDSGYVRQCDRDSAMWRQTQSECFGERRHSAVASIRRYPLSVLSTERMYSRYSS